MRKMSRLKKCFIFSVCFLLLIFMLKDKAIFLPSAKVFSTVINASSKLYVSGADVVEQIKNIENALDIYRLHNGLYPTTEQGLEALVTKPTIDPQPKRYPEGGYLKKIPLDPWGNPFIYRCHGKEGPIDIISCGPDGEERTGDDLTNYNPSRIEPMADSYSLQESIKSTSSKSDVALDVTADFPDAALSALVSFKKIDRELSQKRFQLVEMGRKGRPISPYVYYDEFKSLPSVDNSMFVYRDRRKTIKDNDNIEEDSIQKTDSVSYLSIIRNIVGEEDIHFIRHWAFVSYGDFSNFLLYTPSMKHDKPLSYEKFLTSVFLSLSEIRIGMPDSIYLSFVEEVLLPLSHDLAQKGQARPPIVINGEFIERMSRYVHQERSKLPKWLFPTKYLISSFTFPEPIPHEILWSGIYRKIDHLIRAGYYKDPYYLFKYYRTLPTEGDDVVVWGEALDVDIWCNYYSNSLMEHELRIKREYQEKKEYFSEELNDQLDKDMDQYLEEIDETKNLILNLRRCGNVF